MRLPFLTLAAALSAVALADPGTPEYAAGMVLVRPKAGQATAAHAAYRAMGATLTRAIPQIGWEAIRLKPGMTAQAALGRLAASRAVAAAEPGRVLRALEFPNDPMVSAQYSLTKMQLGAAWGLGKGERSAVVAIVDTGVDVSHPDLKAACVPGYDTADNDSNVMGTNPHGTHCAGIAAATGDNGIGIAGVAYGASIMPIKVFPDGFDGAYDDAIAAGIVWATDHGANVVSMSLGGFGTTEGVLKDAIDYADAHNVVVLAAAGNSATNARFSPAEYARCIAVGATDAADARAGFSNYGADWVDVAAPGVGIRSTVFNHAYEDYSGTSMACPNVAGVATLLISQAGVGTLTSAEVRALIEDHCDDIGTWIARGRVNAYRAMLATPLPVTEKPAPTDLAPVEGTLVGAAPDLLEGDGVRATLQSVKRTGVGLVGAMASTFAPTTISRDGLRTATIRLNVTGDRLAILQLYVRKESTGKWLLYKTVPTTGAAQTFTMKMDKATLEGYAPSDALQLMVRAYVPTRLAAQVRGVTQIDELSVTYAGRRVRNAP